MKNRRGKNFANFLNLFIVVSLFLGVVSYFKKYRLPLPSQIVEELKDDPFQEKISERNYVFDYLGAEYVVHPVAEYEIAGLIVTHNDISEFSDIYHTSSSVDIRDLCLIWGSNLSTTDFHSVKFWSEPWSCQYQYGPEVRNFRHDQVSNTHILSSSPAVRKKIGEMHVGDQVLLRGKLINYAPACCSEQLRSTSLVRTDSGNGACEVMMVSEAEILKPANTLWHKLFFSAKIALLLGLIIKIYLFFNSAYSY